MNLLGGMMVSARRVAPHDIGQRTGNDQPRGRRHQNSDDLHRGHSSSLPSIHLPIICSARDPKKQLIVTMTDATEIVAVGSSAFTACVRPPTANTAIAMPFTKVAVSFVRSLRTMLMRRSMLVVRIEGKARHFARLAEARR